jgi:hypothetical protein
MKTTNNYWLFESAYRKIAAVEKREGKRGRPRANGERDMSEKSIAAARQAYQIIEAAGVTGVKVEQLGRMIGLGHNVWIALNGIEYTHGAVICEDDTHGPARVWLVEAIE